LRVFPLRAFIDRNPPLRLESRHRPVLPVRLTPQRLKVDERDTEEVPVFAFPHP
jgi:hypothetical protein